MRTRTVAFALATLGLVGATVGSADALLNIPTPIGTVGVDDGNGYLLVFDATAPLPFTGYIGVTSAPGCAFGLTGGPYEEGVFHTPVPCESFNPGPGVPGVPVPLPGGLPDPGVPIPPV